MKTLGLIGGLGPLATAIFLQRIIEMTDAKTDQEHLDIIVFNRPDVPNRTDYLLDPNHHPSPLPSILQTAQSLDRLGASCIAMSCVTAHVFARQIQASLSVPLINMVTETAAYLKTMGVRCVGIAATTGTARSGLFQQALRRQQIQSILPPVPHQALLMSLIYDQVKAGKPANPEAFRQVSDALFAKGCECIILGCTELSVLPRAYDLGDGFLDAMDVLASRCIIRCDKPLKPAYQHLVRIRRHNE